MSVITVILAYNMRGNDLLAGVPRLVKNNRDKFKIAWEIFVLKGYF